MGIRAIPICRSLLFPSFNHMTNIPFLPFPPFFHFICCSKPILGMYTCTHIHTHTHHLFGSLSIHLIFFTYLSSFPFFFPFSLLCCTPHYYSLQYVTLLYSTLLYSTPCIWDFSTKLNIAQMNSPVHYWNLLCSIPLSSTQLFIPDISKIISEQVI